MSSGPSQDRVGLAILQKTSRWGQACDLAICVTLVCSKPQEVLSALNENCKIAGLTPICCSMWTVIDSDYLPGFTNFSGVTQTTKLNFWPL